MKKMFFSLFIGGLSISGFACDKCNLSNSTVSSTEQVSVEDLRKEVFKKIIFEENKLLSLKNCINKNTTEEINNCVNSVHSSGCSCSSCSSNVQPLKSPFLNKN